jgi:uncharacterized membrane protein YhaH (DUF805 family)
MNVLAGRNLTCWVFATPFLFFIGTTMDFDNYLECWRKYAVFNGRAGREEFWQFTLFDTALMAAIWTCVICCLYSGQYQQWFGLFYLSLYAYLLAAAIPRIAVAFRRLHDTSRSGWWWLLLNLLPLGSIALLIFYCQDSMPGENQYGPNPKGL